MASYIYLPVPTPEMLDFAAQWNAMREGKGKSALPVLSNLAAGPGKGLLRRLGRGCLRGVRSDDKLYILAHGNGIGSRNIGASRGARQVYELGVPRWRGGTLKMYNAVELSVVLEEEGLTKEIRDVRVFACGSSLTPPTAPTSFAEALARAMRARGYANVQVTGYRGSVRPSFLVMDDEGNAARVKVVELSQDGAVTMVRASTQSDVFSGDTGGGMTS